ncbi:2Fe-2S iron-sulfur cluster binding domain-containing protein [Flavobacteriaceae bacterium R38]|nr:2Fe-2S iron-sulfur cluster binding domain-containing protein [Flavobacteriaceae bacterium R38]
MATFHSLKIKEISQNTPSSVTVSFDIPEAQKDNFSFDAGQYITIKKELNGEELRRAYSICSAKNSGGLSIGIKEVTDGTFSKYANTSLKAGDVLEIHEPEGKFTLTSTSEKRTIAAFAAGSGITPIMSIMKTLLEEESESSFVLVYGNKTVEETMFHSEINELINTYPDRLSVYFTYSQEASESILSGRIDKSTVNYIIKNVHKDQVFDAFYLCGPEEMITTVSDTLKESNIAEDKIKFELFTSSSDNSSAQKLIADGNVQIKVQVDDEEFSFTADKSKRILDVILEQKIDAPYSCQGGICSSCIAKVTEGKAEMTQNQILTDTEVAEGLILTCQAHALTDTITVDYDDV